MEFLEELKFDEKGLIPAVVQDYATNAVLMVGYMNEEAIIKTIETGKAHFFSRSRQKLWLKGETSGCYQHVRSLKTDCDKDTLLVSVEQVNVACHTGNYSCFFYEVQNGRLKQKIDVDVLQDTEEDICDCTVHLDDKADVLFSLFDVIKDRKVNPKEGSYTNYLFEKGIDKILKKLGEESSEVIIAAKNNSKDEIIYETSDLLYHLLVMLTERGVELEQIFNELKRRR